jgi:hypothetical protein
MVERSERNPNCSGGRRLLISRKFFRRVERIFSKTFPAMFRREMGRYERGLVGSFPGLGIMTVMACFQAGGKWWARMQLLKITVRATMAIRGRFLNIGAFKFVGPRGLFALQLRRRGRLGGLRRKSLTLLITCAKKASSKWGLLGTWWICSRVSAKQFAFSRGVFMIALFRTRWWTVVVFCPVRVWN